MAMRFWALAFVGLLLGGAGLAAAQGEPSKGATNTKPWAAGEDDLAKEIHAIKAKYRAAFHDWLAEQRRAYHEEAAKIRADLKAQVERIRLDYEAQKADLLARCREANAASNDTTTPVEERCASALEELNRATQARLHEARAAAHAALRALQHRFHLLIQDHLEELLAELQAALEDLQFELRLRRYEDDPRWGDKPRPCNGEPQRDTEARCHPKPRPCDQAADPARPCKAPEPREKPRPKPHEGCDAADRCAPPPRCKELSQGNATADCKPPEPCKTAANGTTECWRKPHAGPKPVRPVRIEDGRVVVEGDLPLVSVRADAQARVEG